MAQQLERPDVTIEQVVTDTSPTVSKPALVPVIVGPSYQIVSPLTADGILDDATVVLTAAQITGTPVTGPLGVAGCSLRVNVDRKGPVNVTLPATSAGLSGPLSTTLVAQSVNKQLAIAGARMVFVNGKCVITSNTKGDTSSLELLTPIGTSAYAAMGLPTTVVAQGKSAYDNLDAVIPFLSLPSTKADVTELKFNPDKLDIYRHYGNSLYKVSKTSAVNWTSWSLGHQDKNSGVSLACTPNRLQPAIGGRSQLVGTRAPAAKTNTVFDPGTPASLVIPLANRSGNGRQKWPDATGSNYMTITAFGLQDYLNGSPTVGNFIGSAGNSISVVFVDGNASADTPPVWDAGAETLTFTLHRSGNYFTVTNAGLVALCAQMTGAAASIHVDVTYDPTMAAVPAFDGLTYTAITAQPSFLSGGVDPVNFLADVGADYQPAGITGSVHVESTTSAADLGIDGQTLSVSVNGSPWIDCILTGVLDTCLTTALSTSGATVHWVTTLKDPMALGTVKVLQIKGVAPGYGSNYHDSTLQLKASSPLVIEKLFAGASKSTTRVNVSTDSNDRRVPYASLDPDIYNFQAQTPFEIAIVPGAQSITLDSVKALGALVVATADTSGDDTIAALTDATPAVLGVTLGGTPYTLTTADDVGDIATWSVLADQLQASADSVAAGKLVVGIVTVNGKKCLALSTVFGASSTIRLTSVGPSALQTALFPNASQADFYTKTATSAVTTVTLDDKGALNTLRVNALGNGLDNVVISSYAGFIPGPANYSELLLEDGSGSQWHGTRIRQATGGIQITFQGGVGTTGSGGTKKPLFLQVSNGIVATASFSRLWASSLCQTPADYTGRVFHGCSSAVAVSDSFYANGIYQGAIVQINNLTVGGQTFTGAQLVLSDAGIDVGAPLTDWYIRAERLDENGADRNCAPELEISVLDSTLSIKQAVNTDPAGIALAGTRAALYAGYTALRLDVSAASAKPAMLTFNSVTEVDSAIGPVIPDNPLAYGLSKAFENAPTIAICAIGIDDITADAPNGTVESYGRAFEYLALKEVYLIAPMTFDREVHKLLATHCTAYSAPDGKKERTGITCVQQPTEREPLLAISGTMNISAGDAGPDTFKLQFTSDSLHIFAALNGKKDATGATLAVSNGTSLTPANGVYVDRAGDSYKYLVDKIIDTQTVQVTCQYPYDAGQGPGSMGNDDSFYQTDAGKLDTFLVSGEPCTIYVRQFAIDASNTTGKLEVCDALNGYAAGFGMSSPSAARPPPAPAS